MKIISTLLLLFALQIYCYSQKTAPVAGHAARLVDLLKKDYSSLDIASRNETILKDMDEVLATFRVYAGVDYNPDKFILKQTVLTDTSSIGIHQIKYEDNDLKSAYEDYIESSTKYNNMSKTIASVNVSSSTADTESGPYEILKGLNDDLQSTKKTYEESKIKDDANQLLILYGYFKDSNPYLSFMLELFIFKYDQVTKFRQDVYSKVNYTSSIQKALPFFGGDLAFKAAIDGLSKFLAKRIKDELTTYAVQKVQEYLNNPKPESYLNELMVLLPVTTSYLKSFDSTRTLNFINDLKQYIEQDLNNLMNNAPNLKDTPRFRSYIKMHPDLDFAFEALELIPQIQKLENPIDYFDILENSRNIQRWGNMDIEVQAEKIANSKKQIIGLFNKSAGYDAVKAEYLSKKGDYKTKKDQYEKEERSLNSINKLADYDIIIAKYDKITKELESAQKNLDNSQAKFTKTPNAVTGKNILDAKADFNAKKKDFDAIKKDYQKIDPLYLTDKSLFATDIIAAQNNLLKSKQEMDDAEKEVKIKEKDFNGLPENQIDSFNRYIKSNFEQLKVANDKLLPIAEDNQNKLKTAISVYNSSLTEEKKDILKYNIANSIKFASMIAHSLVVVENNKPRFASTAFVAAYSSEVNFYMLYLGFLNQQNRKFYNVSYYIDSNKKTLKEGLENLMVNIIKPETVTAAEKKYQIISSNMIQIASNAERLNTSFNDIKKANSAKEKVTAEQVHSLAGDMIDFADGVVRVIDTLATDKDLKLFDAPSVETIVKTTKPYFITARTVNDIYLDLHTKNYTTALIKAIEIPLAFGKDNSQSKVYNSITALVNNADDINQLRNLKKLFSYKKVYTDEDKLKSQKELGLWVKISLDNTPNLSDYSKSYETVNNLIQNKDVDNQFSTLLCDFETSIKNKSTEFYKEYAGINTDEILKNVDDLLTKHNITDVKIKTSIKNTIKDAIDNSIEYYVFGDEVKNEQLKKDTKLMIQNFKYYMPEVFPDVFEFKDDNTIKLIHFVNDIANADSAEDVEKALNTFALPPGSSSLKEHTSSYFSINSYPGLYFGVTWKDFNGSKETYSTGITAPVGFYFQPWPAGKKVTLGIYVPVIDIAAPVRLRLNSDNDTEILPDFDFMDIFSPGIYFSLGFNKSPFAVNIGGQFGPKLKALSPDTSTSGGSDPTPQIVNEKQVFYFGISAVIDIPLFTLFARSQN
ncbi:hypothetical protein NYQ10_10170 [Flavobacterium johnsoniae]|uniref:hypothetical protein n=1 Tax=Flavobacterium johnsoniae TaxID=986 RepID=UPI0025B12B56|nr:hypothetical protein [Flavobacterium johnsoniae]WJS96801.1 hypothetical protein NYQ10_10170 [Flavobacterium johnsoniae]